MIGFTVYLTTQEAGIVKCSYHKCCPAKLWMLSAWPLKGGNSEVGINWVKTFRTNCGQDRGSYCVSLVWISWEQLSSLFLPGTWALMVLLPHSFLGFCVACMFGCMFVFSLGYHCSLPSSVHSRILINGFFPEVYFAVTAPWKCKLALLYVLFCNCCCSSC